MDFQVRGPGLNPPRRNAQSGRRGPWRMLARPWHARLARRTDAAQDNCRPGTRSLFGADASLTDRPLRRVLQSGAIIRELSRLIRDGDLDGTFGPLTSRYRAFPCAFLDAGAVQMMISPSRSALAEERPRSTRILRPWTSRRIDVLPDRSRRPPPPFHCPAGYGHQPARFRLLRRTGKIPSCRKSGGVIQAFHPQSPGVSTVRCEPQPGWSRAAVAGQNDSQASPPLQRPFLSNSRQARSAPSGSPVRTLLRADRHATSRCTVSSRQASRRCLPGQ